MCITGCSGSCINRLKEQEINSDESLNEINHLLIKITACGPGTGTDKTIFMTEAINLKTEARELLDEVNNYRERNPAGQFIAGSTFEIDNIFNDSNFKQRLFDLKQRINLLSTQTFGTQ